MTREDIIEGLNKVENELYLKHGDEDLANQIHNISEALRLNQLSFSPAEGAKEILQKYMDMSMIICPLHVVPRSVAIDAMTEVAALHAQRLAEKMVSERLRKELMMFGDYFNNLDPNDHILVNYILVNDIDKYLKSKER